MSREDPQLKLRLPEEMKTRIAAVARTNGRSLNAEIIQALELFFPAETDSNEVKITLSLPAKLRDELETQAIYKARSLHDEIVRLLQVFAAGNVAEDDFKTLVKRLEDSVHYSERLAKELRDGVQEVTLLGQADTQWLEHIIYKYAFEKRLSRTEAILDILKQWLSENGYLKRRE